jgi:hypothetical protein
MPSRICRSPAVRWIKRNGDKVGHQTKSNVPSDAETDKVVDRVGKSGKM